MSKSFTPVVGLADLPLEPFTQGSRYESLDAGVAERLLLTQIGATYTEVPPGKSACPFHVHRVEDELFVIFEGSGDYRFGDKTYAVTAGDILGAPRGGPEFAHNLTNTGTTPLKYLAISSKAETEICEYPDSGKFLAINRDFGEKEANFRFIGRMQDGRDYWEGEDG